MERVTERAGGREALERILRDRGVSRDELRILFRRGEFGQRFSEERVLSAETLGPPDQAIRAWLDAERPRRNLQVLDSRCA